MCPDSNFEKMAEWRCLEDGGGGGGQKFQNQNIGITTSIASFHTYEGS